MSANLYPGIKSLHLVLDTPYDQIRTDDVRDDLVGVKVWYSTTQGFDPTNSQGTLAFDGLSQSITIANLSANTTYYVRYAFISSIDPTTYTISAELTADVLDETVSVYGYLTNDPTAVATNADGSGGDYTLTQGVFKVYNYTEDVTGNGVVYGVVANTTFGDITATIDPVTGVYSASAMSADAGSITFYAIYNDITVVKVWNLLKTSAGNDAPSLRINANGNAFIYRDESASTSSTGLITLTSVLQNITGTPTYTAVAYKRDGTLLGPVEFSTGAGSISITSTQFNATAYNNQVGYVLVTSTLGTVSDSISIYRINDGSEQITVEQSNQAHTIPAFEDGSVAQSGYDGSGNIIKVKQGNTYLPVDNTSPYAPGTWRITTIAATGITADTTPTVGSDYVNFDTHAAMTADVAYIDYTITGSSTTGKAFSIVVRQSFSKSKAGVKGSDAPIVTLTASSQTFIAAKNTGTISPASITVTATVANITNPQYAWTINGAAQTSSTSTLTVNSFTGNPYLVKVVVTGSNSVTAFDQLTIYSLREGDDSLQAGLTNENQTVSCDATGTPISGQLPLSSQMRVVRGSEILTSGVTYSKVSETGMTSTINATTGIISITAVSADFGTATYRATVGTTTLDRIFTFSKSKNGVNGTDGASAVTINYSNDSLTVPQTSAGVSTWTGSGGILQVYDGTVLLTLDSTTQSTTTPTTAGRYVLDITKVSGDTLTEPTFSGTSTVTLSDWSGTLTTATVYRITAYIKTLAGDTVTLATDTSISPSKQGASATAYWVTTSVAAIQKSSTGTFTPNSITYRMFSATGTSAPAPYAGRFVIAVSTDGLSYNNSYASSIDQSTYTFTIPSNAKSIKVSGYLAGGTTTLIDEEISNVVSDGAAGAPGSQGPVVEISGLTTFYKSSGGAISPTNATLTATVLNIENPSYSWEITGATPAIANGSSVTITPTGLNTTITAKLTVTGTDLSGYVVVRGTNIVEQGATGQAGANGVMSAFPSIYKWAPAISPPTRPSTASTYTWSTGAYSAPSGWTTQSTANYTPGEALYSITVPLTVGATTVSSALNWADTTYALRAITVNGSEGSDGNPGSATFLINRGSLPDNTQPTANEVSGAIGRLPVAGDIATISYNNSNSSVAYRATSSGASATWALQTSYITGSLIVENSISGDKIIANTLSVNKITSGGTSVSVTNVNGETVTGQFKLGSGDRTPIGNTAAIGSFTCSTNTGWALAAFNTNTIEGEWGNGILAATSSPGGAAIGCYTPVIFTDSYTNVRSTAAIAETGAGMYGTTRKPSSYTQTTRVNNLATDHTRSQFTGALPNYGLLAQAWGAAANIGAAVKILSETDFQNSSTNWLSFSGTLSINAGGYTGTITLNPPTPSPYSINVGAYLRKRSGTASFGSAVVATVTSVLSKTTIYVSCAVPMTAGSITFVQAFDDLPVASTELSYCTDDQTTAYCGIFVRRHVSGANKALEACRVTIAPSWSPYGLEIIGGPGSPYTATSAYIYGGVVPFTGAHEAQSDIPLTIGDIVIDKAIIEKQDISNVFSQVVPSSIIKDSRAFGVVAKNFENKAVPFNRDDLTGANFAQGFVPSSIEIAKPVEPWKLKYTVIVNGLGEGQVNVCGENGNIAAGDLIVTSSMPGKGMRQDDDIIRSYTVAKARESVTFSSPTEVKMIACSYLCS